MKSDMNNFKKLQNSILLKYRKANLWQRFISKLTSEDTMHIEDMIDGKVVYSQTAIIRKYGQREYFIKFGRL